MNLAHLLARVAAQEPDRPAVYRGAELHLRYGAFAQRCATLAAALRAAGLQPGDRVAIFMRNHVAYLEVLWGAWWAGLVPVPINFRLHAKEAAWIVENSGARWGFFAGTGGLPGLQRCVDVEGADYAALLAGPGPGAGTGVGIGIEPRDGADLAWLFYTSGTTGRPKGVMITHRNLLTMALCYGVDVDPVGPGDVTVYAAPLSHGAGIYSVPHVLAGARHCVPASGGFDAAELFELGARLGPLSAFAAPTMVRTLVDHAAAHGLGGEAFKTIAYGGAPMYVPDIERALDVMGPRLVQIYGQGESPMTITALSRAHLTDRAHPRHRERIASVGVAQSAVEVRVADEHGAALPPGEIGEVLVRGDAVMAGYWQNPAATAQALRDGWLWTGDVGCLDADGFLTLKDRSRDVIITGGSNIYPREVEEVLLLCPDVAEAAVVGVPDAHWGEAVVACVVPAPGRTVDAAALDALCLDHIARFKRPRRYEVVDTLPRNAYGKVLKTALREKLAPRPDPA